METVGPLGLLEQKSHNCWWRKKREGAGVSNGETEKIKIATWFHSFLFLLSKDGTAMQKKSELENCENFVKLFG